ncbi:MAG: aldehyde ferredoxin oxidoreductase [Desulfobacteraceae bacterium]|nr:MAG: aldehyde ferredoxin oxidoreductase [Desulfobacteraceae bacterium]
METFLRVDVGRKTAVREKVAENYLKVGGRSLTVKLLLNEITPSCEPLGKNNKLIIATGLFAGTGLSSSGRTSIGGKSPLTGTIKESNSGGILADRLARIGIKAVIIEGLPQDDSWHLLKITPHGCSFIPADPYLGMGTYTLCETILTQFPQAAITCIGPAGEKLYSAAAIAITDKEGKPGRFCGRGGLGALMGSKKIKAIIVEGQGKVPLADEEKFKNCRKRYTQLLKDAPSSAAYREFGTAAMVGAVNALSGLPVRNFSQGSFDQAEQIYAESINASIRQRGGEGKITHACMPGCVIGCSNVFPDANGKAIVSPIEYETIGLLGPNLGISSMDVITRLNFLCNDIGLDTIETGAALGVAMEAGVLRFGDGDGAARILEEARRATVLGRVIGNGVVVTAKVFGIINVPAVKGQAMPAYDPRAIKGMGVTYATSAMGADHTAGPTARSPVEHKSPDGQAALSLKMQKLLPIFDCTGLCLFTIGAVAPRLDLVLDLLNARFGWGLDQGWFEKMSVETLKDEKRFNQLAGFTSVHDRLPECFTERPLPELGTVFDVPEEDLDHLVKYE